MKTLIEELSRKLDERLALFNQEKDLFKRLELSKQAVRNAISELENFAANHLSLYSDIVSLILYNKHWAPPFYAKLLFFTSCSKLKSLTLCASADEQLRLHQHELDGVSFYFRSHSDFFKYYYSEATDRDHLLFTDVALNSPPLDEMVLTSPLTSLNRGCLQVAFVLANKLYEDYLEQELQQFHQSLLSTGPVAEWAAGQAALAELLMALYEQKAILVDKKPATMVWLRAQSKAIFGLSLESINTVDNINRTRKKERTPFLKKLIGKLEVRWEKLGEINDSSR